MGMNKMMLGGLADLIPNITKEHAIKILSYRNQETQIFANILTGFRDEIEIDEEQALLDPTAQMMVKHTARAMPNLSNQHKAMLEHPKHEETKMAKVIIDELQDKFPEEYKDIIVKNMKYLAVGIEGSNELRAIFNDTCRVLSSRNYEKIREWLNGLEKNNRQFALKMTLHVGRKVETNQAFREKFTDILDRFEKFYNKIG